MHWNGQIDIGCRKVKGQAPMYAEEAYWKANPLDYVMPHIMIQYTMFFVCSQIVFHLLRPLKQIKFVCYMLAGIMLGPALIGTKMYAESRMNSLEWEITRTHLAYIGLSYYVFLVAVKIDFGMISRMGKKAWTIGTVSLFAPFITILTAWIIALLKVENFEVGTHVLLFVTLAYNLSTTSSANLASALDELDLITTDLGELSLSCSLLNDLFTWIFLASTIILRQNGDKGIEKGAIQSIISGIVILLFIVWVIRPIILHIIQKTPEGQPIGEIYIVAILVGVLVMRSIAESTGVNALQGPLLFGLVIPAGPPLGSALTNKMELIVSELLMPFFYMDMGATVRSFSFSKSQGETDKKAWVNLLVFEMIIIVGYITKFVGTLWASMQRNLSFQDSLKLSLFMSMRGIMEFLVYMFFETTGRISNEIHAALVLSAMAETAMITPLIKLLCDPKNRMDEWYMYSTRSLRTTSYDSELRILSCVHHEDDVSAMINLLEASNSTTIFPLYAYVVHMIELIGQTAPLLTPHKQHRRRCEHNGCRHIMTAFRNYTKNSDLRVTIQPFTLITPLKSMHEGICRVARERHIPLVLVPFVVKNAHDTRGSSFNNIVSKIQTFAPCTVGILVDKGSCFHDNRHIIYRIGVIFIGGEDDRETIAYASRMVGNRSITITLIHIKIKKEMSDFEERRLDDALVKEFRLKSGNYPLASYQCLAVEDWEQAFKEIRSVTEQGYNLIMVGRKQRHNSRMVQEMLSWTEYPELGVIGDMLASLNDSKKMESLLVIQHSGKVDIDIDSTILI